MAIATEFWNVRSLYCLI